MIPTRDKALIENIGAPSSQELKGRVGYVRLVNKGKLDVTIITAYIPVEGQDREISGKICEWIEEITMKLGSYSHIFITVDANGHVGKGITSEEEKVTCGPYGAEDTNWNGKRMITALTNQELYIF